MPQPTEKSLKRMQIYTEKYWEKTCLLFFAPDGTPITEYLPEDHEGRQIYGIVKDPTPDKGRELRHKADEKIAEWETQKELS